MMKLVNWIAQYPPGVLTLSVAIISAAVALTVTVTTQWALSRRSSRELLTKKLEELYLILNDAASESIARSAEIHKCFFISEHTTSDSFYSAVIGSAEVQKKLIMYVQLYFPRLSQPYQAIYEAHNSLIEMSTKLLSETPPKLEDFKDAFKRYQETLGAMEKEIVSNKAVLTGSSRLFRKYRKSKKKPLMPLVNEQASVTKKD